MKFVLCVFFLLSLLEHCCDTRGRVASYYYHVTNLMVKMTGHEKKKHGYFMTVPVLDYFPLEFFYVRKIQTPILFKLFFS